MENLLRKIKECKICEKHIEPNPVVFANKKSKIIIVGQAPGTKVHQSGIPWDDASGKQLRKWLEVTDEQFYDTNNFGIIPMGFCYPGKGKSGDLPPRKECAPQWHQPLLKEMSNVQLIILIGMYAQNYYLKDKTKSTLTETVKAFEEYLPNYLVLPHPSPRNRFWLTKNPWFEKVVLPQLRGLVKELL
ncbi:uracil-DNA glycosylase family protein [Tenacibaculum caenipelagi]|uniref:Uracil-DNA glycosylase family 4 n=1 Tax=Tenacibaculum caenipelagi TaxID=1325435 RepID=A0A4R6TEM9_9FLAO|nr:uracil-DNA glycosylase family protein [Tenacibaculum caenipelagi]TDQ28378.1 uracil-DNA glycosylase family 4 [Tenacibaculum caenipelagi]